MKDKISQAQLEVIDLLIKKFPDIVFGGSIALNALGLINRPVGDIDVFYTNKAEYVKFLHGQPISDSQYENDVEMLGFITHRVGVKIKGQKVCGFEIPAGKETRSLSINVCGRMLQIQNPVYAIIAKAIYSDKTEKHAKDLEVIQESLLNLLIL